MIKCHFKAKKTEWSTPLSKFYSGQVAQACNRLELQPSVLPAEKWEFEPLLGKSNFKNFGCLKATAAHQAADRGLRNQKLSVGIGSYIFKFVAMLRHNNWKVQHKTSKWVLYR